MDNNEKLELFHKAVLETAGKKSEAMLEEELYNDSACFLVAEGPEGEVLGYAGLHVVLDEGYIDNVAVDPACRRQGIADALIDTFTRFGAEKMAFLPLEVRESNAGARHLYDSYGFAQEAVRKAYYSSPTEDAIIMWNRRVQNMQ